jgi:hypothetical protein
MAQKIKSGVRAQCHARDAGKDDPEVDSLQIVCVSSVQVLALSWMVISGTIF